MVNLKSFCFKTLYLFSRMARLWFHLVAFLVLCGGPVIAQKSGNFSYSVDGNKVTITGYPTTATGSVVIPDTIADKPVTSIGYWAFRSCDKLTSVTIGKGVTDIGDGAFSGCAKLTSVTIPDSVTRIGTGAFNKCLELTSVKLPDTLTSIGKNVFTNCAKLTSVTIPKNVADIGSSAFGGCVKLQSMTLPKSVTGIGDYAFAGCAGMTDLYFEGDAPKFGHAVFSLIDNKKLKLTIQEGSKGFESPKLKDFTRAIKARPKN